MGNAAIEVAEKANKQSGGQYTPLINQAKDYMKILSPKRPKFVKAPTASGSIEDIPVTELICTNVGIKAIAWVIGIVCFFFFLYNVAYGGLLPVVRGKVKPEKYDPSYVRITISIVMTLSIIIYASVGLPEGPCNPVTVAIAMAIFIIYAIYLFIMSTYIMTETNRQLTTKNDKNARTMLGSLGFFTAILAFIGAFLAFTGHI